MCDRSDGGVEYWPQRAYAHVACAPLHWKKDRADLEAFLARIHVVTYDLNDWSGEVTGHCHQCGWSMTTQPAGVGDLYRQAQKHVKGDRDSS